MIYLIILIRIDWRREGMKGTTKNEIYSWLKALAFGFIVAIICRHFIFTPTTVLGESMAPTFQDHDRVIVSKTSTIDRFDVVVFDAPDAVEQYYVKRVIGLPGDQIMVEDDVLFINGKALPEPYLTENKANNQLVKLTEDFLLEEKTGEATVPAGMYFVMGDNRLKSKDSRIFGFISNDSVVGEVKFRYYPFDGIGIPK